MTRVARPRVIITSPDASVTVNLIASLNPKRYRVEHIHDLSEALLRAEFVLAHAVIAHVDELDESVNKRLTRAIDRGISLVVVSNSATVAIAAKALGAHPLRFPYAIHDVKRTVLDAVSEAHALRSSDSAVVSRGEPRSLTQRVVVLVSERDAAEIMAATLRSQLAVSCDATPSANDAMGELVRGFDCLVTRPSFLLGSEDGAKLARKLARRGISIVPLSPSEDLDASTAGQIAWALVPQVRRSLQARARLTRPRTPE